MISPPPTWFFEWVRILGVVVSAFLSFLLVILYKRQQEQLAAQYEAVLEVTDVEWHEDNAIIWLSNFGNGVAKNLCLTTLVKADNDDHRNYAVRHNSLKRIDVGSEWGNHIRPDEEEIPFIGKSKINKPAPYDYRGNWAPIRFSSFVRRAKDNNATEVKYCHVVEGKEVSGEKCAALLNPMVRSIDPQKFDSNNSLENLPSYTRHGQDTTFMPYFRKSWGRDFIFRVYCRSVRLLNLVLPKIHLQPRRPDTSGTKRVKRVLLRQQVRLLIRKLRSITDRIPSRFSKNMPKP